MNNFISNQPNNASRLMREARYIDFFILLFFVGIAQTWIDDPSVAAQGMRLFTLGAFIAAPPVVAFAKWYYAPATYRTSTLLWWLLFGLLAYIGMAGNYWYTEITNTIVSAAYVLSFIASAAVLAYNYRQHKTDEFSPKRHHVILWCWLSWALMLLW